jgi:hypothetical protein
VWTFDAHEDRVELEESVFLAGSDGPRRTVQIVIQGHARSVPRVHWSFAHMSASQAAAKRKPADTGEPSSAISDEPELPL